MNATYTYLSFFGWWNPLNLIYIFLLHLFYSESESEFNQKVVEEIEKSLGTIRLIQGTSVKGNFGSGVYARYSVRPEFLRELVPIFCEARRDTYHYKGCSECYDTCLTETWWEEYRGIYSYHSDKQREHLWRRLNSPV
jgi:hypothetical protein